MYDKPVISLDVAATANAVAGLSDDPVLDGVNLVPYLTGVKVGMPHEVLFWRWNGQAAIRKGKWKYLMGGGREYLFDLDTDAEEKNTVLKQHLELAKRLRAELAEWSDTLDPPGLDKTISAAANRYFDWYLDGKRTAPTTSPNRKRKSRK